MKASAQRWLRAAAVRTLLRIAEAFDKAANRLAHIPELPQEPPCPDRRAAQMAFNLMAFAQAHKVHGAMVMSAPDSPIVVWCPSGAKATVLREFAFHTLTRPRPRFVADPPEEAQTQ